MFKGVNVCVYVGDILSYLISRGCKMQFRWKLMTYDVCMMTTLDSLMGSCSVVTMD